MSKIIQIARFGSGLEINEALAKKGLEYVDVKIDYDNETFYLIYKIEIDG